MSSTPPNCAPGDYEQELIDLLVKAIPTGRAVSATALAVDSATFTTDDEVVSERRFVDALIRRHWSRCTALGLIDGTCEIAFHPDTGVPQIFATQPTPEDSFSAEEQARELLGALIADHWSPGEPPLAIETWMRILAGDDAVDTFDPRLLRQSLMLTRGQLEQSHYLLLCLALLSGLAPDEALHLFAIMDRGPLDQLLGPHPDDATVMAARSHVMAAFYRDELGRE